MAKSGYKGISRIDQESRNTYGWYVRVTFNGQQRSKFFSDEANGGRKKALEKAIEYRNQAEAELGRPRTDRTVVGRSPRNRSGIIGVQRKTRVYVNANGEKVERHFYEVTWNPWPGKLCRTWVSIDELGEKEALRRACAIRRQKEREMYGSVIKPNWAASLGKLLEA
ncbi:MAG TPA: AP2 domain-containing protein [Blastocatellia bacterium]|nr:AP2 domain-containing protein [Blastocatellia bacterium]